MSDYPELPKWFARMVLGPLITAEKVSLKHVEWLQPVDDIFMIAGHFELFALIADYLQRTAGGLPKALDLLKVQLGAPLKVMIDKFSELNEDKDELRAQICEYTGFSEDSEVFKVLELSQ